MPFESFYFKGIAVLWKSASEAVCIKPRGILSRTESLEQKYRRSPSPRAAVTRCGAVGSEAQPARRRPLDF